jgi:membrane-associated phospholipid phosphatase
MAAAMVSPSVDPKRAATTALTGFVVLVGSMLGVGLVGELFLFDSSVGRLELEWTEWIAGHRVAVLDTLATVGSSFTDTWTVIGTAFGASTMLWVTGYRGHAWTLPIGLAVELTVFLAVATIIGRERPDVTPLGSVPSTSSFPSGHVAAGVVLYGGLVVIAASIVESKAVARLATIAAALLIAWVASARVYEAVHHPSDVVGGAMLGMGALVVAASSTNLAVPARRATAARPTDRRRRLRVTNS